MPSVQQLYKLFRIEDGQLPTITGFTDRNLRQTYQATIREMMALYGYPDRAITLGDQAVLDKLLARSGETADRIQSVYNRMLLGRLQNGATTTDVQAWLGQVKAYNRTVLVPHDHAWSAQQAVMDFHQQNGIEREWTLVPSTTAGCRDECDTAADASPMSNTDALQYDMPAHQRCPHRLAPTGPVSGTGPSTDTLWTGEATP